MSTGTQRQNAIQCTKYHAICLLRSNNRLPIRPFRLGELLAVDLVDEVDNHVVLLDADSVKVLAHRPREVFLALAPRLKLARHGRGVDADAGRVGQHPVVVGVREAGGRV